MSAALIFLYRWLIKLYPASFRNEFGEEMQAVFSQALSSRRRVLQRAAFFLKELFDLPAALLRQHLAAWFHVRGVLKMDDNESTPPSSRQEALLGTLPFLMYGLICMLVKFGLPFSEFFLWLAFYLITLIWLIIGWVKHFPRWSYGYLGWCITIAFLWGGVPLVLLLPAILVALAWTHSIRPIKQFFLGILNDWTNLSFILFTFPAGLILLYMGDTHPYVLLFMLGSTLAVSLGAYLHLRSSNMMMRIVTLLGGLITGLTLLAISDNAWNIAVNYSQPVPATPWSMLILKWFVSLGMWAVFLFVPVIFSLIRGRKHPQNI